MRGAGAYICGEETALIESLEGKRGEPRMKPPFPAVEGLYKCPTIVNNVETLACIPIIMQSNGKSFKDMGTFQSAGTKLYGISGHVNNPGVYEYPMGTNLKDLIEQAAGGVKDGKKLKAVIPGGLSAPILKADEIDLDMDFDEVDDKIKEIHEKAKNLRDLRDNFLKNIFNRRSLAGSGKQKV